MVRALGSVRFEAPFLFAYFSLSRYAGDAHTDPVLDSATDGPNLCLYSIAAYYCELWM
jgi:hypothetical protein